MADRSSVVSLPEKKQNIDTTTTRFTATPSNDDGKQEMIRDIEQMEGSDTSSISTASQGFVGDNISKTRMYLIILGLCLLYFISALDMTILATVYIDIANSYQDLPNGIWIITTYLLATTAIQPLLGKFSDILGRFYTTLAAAVVFCVGSVICASAQSMGMLLAGRSIQGIGGGGLLSITSVIMGDVTTERNRGKYTGMLAASWGIASAVGPVMGGAIVENASWRIIFWINLPICVPAIVVLFFALNIPTPQGTAREKFQRIDLLGALVFQCFIIPLILAFSWGGQGYKWISGRVLGTICACVVVAVIFLLIEWKVAREPMMPLHLFKVRNVAASSVAHFFLGACCYAPIMFIPLWEISVKQASDVEAGLRLLPLMGAMVVSAGASGAILLRFGRYREMIWACGVLVALGCSLLILYKPSTSSGERIGFLILIGLGLGFGIQNLLIAAQCSVKGLYMAATTTLVLFLRTLGGIFSLSILSSVLNNNLRSGADALAARFPDNEALVRNSLNDQSVIGDSGSVPPELLNGLVDMYQDAMHKVFIGLLPFSVLMVLSTLLFKHVDLNSQRRQTIK